MTRACFALTVSVFPAKTRATKNKSCVSLGYGVTKLLYFDQWEGELDVKHANAFGGGKVVTVNARKGRDGERGKILDPIVGARVWPTGH